MRASPTSWTLADAPSSSRALPTSRRVILELFVGIGGIFGGLEMIRHPLNPLGMKTELIAASPFDTYSWAGSYCWFLLA